MSAAELKQNVVRALAQRDFARAERLCLEAEGKVAAGELQFIRGVIASTQGNTADAVRMLREAYGALPDRADIAFNFGVVLQQSGDLVGAADAWRRAVALDPANTAAWSNLALATAKVSGDAAGVQVYQQALSHHPKSRDLLYNAGNAAYRLGEHAESERLFDNLTQWHPNDALGWTNLGMTQKARGAFADAEASYRRALSLDHDASKPRAFYNLANLLLQNGAWREGFAAYEWRLKLPGAPGSPWPLPAWTPALPKGSRVLLWNDQGLGDGIMYLRFAYLLAELGYRAFAFVQPALRSLAATAPGIEGVFDPNDSPVQMDAALPLCSLPFALGLNAVDIWGGPYLREPTDAPIKLESSRKRAGLVWAGNAAHDNDAHRSMKLGDFAPLFEVAGYDWFSLQLGPRATELGSSSYCDRIRDLSPHLSDMSASAALIAQLDVLVTVDTAPAHLAGALGRPVCTLLPATGTDWRWGRQGDETFWYPSMRLFRQRAPGDWGEAVSQLADHLRRGV